MLILLDVLKKTYTNFHLLIFNFINIQNSNNVNNYDYVIDDKLITINISLMYDPNIWYSNDKAIKNFFTICNPIQEICIKL
jgi:hypothetical protein